MNLDDIKDRLKSEAKSLGDKIQESSAYNNLKDRFDSLSSTGQKLTVFTASLVALLAILYFPWGYYSTSSESVEEFENRRQLIHDMMHVTRETSDAPDLPVPPTVDSLRGRVDEFIKSAGLIDKQKGNIEVVSEPSSLVPAHLSQGILRVHLKMLNLTQIMDLGYQMQSISAAVKLKDLIIEPSTENPTYLDVIYKIIVLNVPAPAPPAAADADDKPNKGAKAPKPEEKSSEEKNAEN